MKKKVKNVMVASALAVVLSGIGFCGYKIYKQQNKIQQTQLNEQKIVKLQNKVNGFYLDNEKKFLAKDVTIDKINQVEDELRKLKGQQLKDVESAGQLNTVVMDKGYALQMLLVKNAIDKVKDNKGALKDNVDLKPIEKKMNELSEFKPEFVNEMKLTLEHAKELKRSLNSKKIGNKVENVNKTSLNNTNKVSSNVVSGDSSKDEEQKPVVASSREIGTVKSDSQTVRSQPRTVSKSSTVHNSQKQTTHNSTISSKKIETSKSTSSTTISKSTRPKTSNSSSSKTSTATPKKPSSTWKEPSLDQLDWSTCEQTETGKFEGENAGSWSNYECK